MRAPWCCFGGQDSTTCLAWALDRHRTWRRIGSADGQRHAVELDCARRSVLLAAKLRPARRRSHHRSGGHAGGAWRHGADQRRHGHSDRPAACRTPSCPPQPAVLTCAASLRLPARPAPDRGPHVRDRLPSYPDCRDDTIKAMQLALNLGMQRRFVLETPLMSRDKAATWRWQHRLGGAALVELIRIESHSRLSGRPVAPARLGYGCGTCRAVSCARRLAALARGQRLGFNPAPPPGSA